MWMFQIARISMLLIHSMFLLRINKMIAIHPKQEVVHFTENKK